MKYSPILYGFRGIGVFFECYFLWDIYVRI